jgi:glucoamylase
MPPRQRLLGAGIAGVLLMFMPAAAQAAAPATGPAPGGPGADARFLGSDKSGLATSTTTDSKVWATVQKEGGLGEVYFPDLATPSARALRFVVADRATKKVATGDVQTRVVDPKSLLFAQTASDPGGRWKLTATYVTDPARATVLAGVRFTAKGKGRYSVHAVYEPALADTRADDTVSSGPGGTLTATDGKAASALVAQPAFSATTNGYRGTSDADLVASDFDQAGPGAVV